jgi:hypothetical protein
MTLKSLTVFERTPGVTINKEYQYLIDKYASEQTLLIFRFPIPFVGAPFLFHATQRKVVLKLNLTIEFVDQHIKVFYAENITLIPV